MGARRPRRRPSRRRTADPGCGPAGDLQQGDRSAARCRRRHGRSPSASSARSINVAGIERAVARTEIAGQRQRRCQSFIVAIGEREQDLDPDRSPIGGLEGERPTDADFGASDVSDFELLLAEQRPPVRPVWFGLCGSEAPRQLVRGRRRGRRAHRVGLGHDIGHDRVAAEEVGQGLQPLRVDIVGSLLETARRR